MKDLEVKTMFADITGRPASDFISDKTLSELGVDSMNILKFIIMLESEHGVEIDANNIGEIANGKISDVEKLLQSLATSNS